jgi:hypothetical protein
MGFASLFHTLAFFLLRLISNKLYNPCKKYNGATQSVIYIIGGHGI